MYRAPKWNVQNTEMEHTEYRNGTYRTPEWNVYNTGMNRNGTYGTPKWTEVIDHSQVIEHFQTTNYYLNDRTLSSYRPYTQSRSKEYKVETSDA